MPEPDGDRPLITFALISYREEAYIRTAIEGAFAQTYRPLEIILSNDCSPDRTFGIMQAMALGYRGPHSIVLNSNRNNLGTGGHINRVMELSRGEIVVIAAGDDISLPHRTEQVYEAFRRGGPGMKSFFSNAVLIDESGNGDALQFEQPPDTSACLLQQIVRNDVFGIVAGSSHAWRRELFDTFGPLLTPLSVEDSAIAFRAALLGEIGYSPEALVRHRRHRNNTWQYTVTDPLRDIRYRTFEGRALLQNWLHDLHTCGELIPGRNGEWDACEHSLLERFDAVQEDITLFESSWPKRASLLSSKILAGMPLRTARYKIGVFLLPLLYQQYVLLKKRLQQDRVKAAPSPPETGKRTDLFH